MTPRKRMSSDEYEDKYYALTDEIENLRDRIEKLGHSRTKKAPKDIAQKLDEITERLKELDNINVIIDPDDYDSDYDVVDEEENRKFDREMLADDIEELRDELGYNREVQKLRRKIKQPTSIIPYTPPKVSNKSKRNVSDELDYDIPSADDMADAYEKTAKSITYKSTGLYLLMLGMATPIGLIVTLVLCVLLGIHIGIAFLLWIGIIVWACIKLVDLNARAPKEYLKNLRKNKR